ncbi:MAG: hypothetical protein K2X43_17270 [Hyphomonadaceae bacterium]|nr:hypothetical protein [Hyphomonadaceae bacterium]
MTGELNIDYEALAQDALRGIVRAVLLRVAKSGSLPGQHHFYIAFNTTAPGVGLSPRLKEKYPQEMTIVLQHRFWDLFVNDDRFEVNLAFDGIPERLVVPFAAIKVFFDPSVPYGLQFEGSDLTGETAHDEGGERAEAADVAPRLSAARARKGNAQGQTVPAGRAEKKPRSPRKPRAAKGGAAGGTSKSRAVSTAAAEADGMGKEARPKLVASTPDQPEAPANDTKVIQLDQFRKK